jgi:hypothetical protein
VKPSALRDIVYGVMDYTAYKRQLVIGTIDVDGKKELHG